MITGVIGSRLFVGLAVMPLLAVAVVPPDLRRVLPARQPRRRNRRPARSRVHPPRRRPPRRPRPPHPRPRPPRTTTTTTTLPPGPTIPAASWTRFDELIADQLTGRGDRAAAVAVSVDGRLVHAAAFGTRTPGRSGRPGDDDTTASASPASPRSITATVVLQLVDAGFLRLDEPVGQRLADVVGVAAGNGVAAVTVRQLLSHTSGFPDYRGQFFGDQFASCEAGCDVRVRPIVVPRPGDEARCTATSTSASSDCSSPTSPASRTRPRRTSCCCSRSGSPGCASLRPSTPIRTRSSTRPAPSARTCSRSAGPGRGSPHRQTWCASSTRSTPPLRAGTRCRRSCRR